MVSAAIRKGIVAPSSRPTTAGASVRLMVSSPTVVRKAENRASAVSAAEPMANPLPMAAVVLPRASRRSVMERICGPAPLISAMPPALSAIGP